MNTCTSEFRNTLYQAARARAHADRSLPGCGQSLAAGNPWLGPPGRAPGRAAGQACAHASARALCRSSSEAGMPACLHSMSRPAPGERCMAPHACTHARPLQARPPRWCREARRTIAAGRRVRDGPPNAGDGHVVVDVQEGHLARVALEQHDHLPPHRAPGSAVLLVLRRRPAVLPSPCEKLPTSRMVAAHVRPVSRPESPWTARSVAQGTQCKHAG